MSYLLLFAGLLLYVGASRWAVRVLAGAAREAVFALLNLGALYWFVFYGDRYGSQRLILYLALIVFQYLMLRLFAERAGWKPWIAFFTPICGLLFFHFLPASTYIQMGHLAGLNFSGIPSFIGLSYLAFRCSHLVLELRNGSVRRPDFLEYVNFAFFFPTMFVGPINTYSNYRRGFETIIPDLSVARCLLRILVGFIKFQFLGSLCNQLTYSGLLLDDHPHPWMDLPVAMVFYYLFLYCNFSGFCDMAIGAAGLIGISVPENFQDPFYSRNMREFWNRWHITLSQYMREVVFAPLSKYLGRALGLKHVNHAIALSIMVVFLLIGVWHGVGWNYVLFGLFQGVGVVTTHYYTIFLKQRLKRDAFKAYNANVWIRAVAVVITFCCFSVSTFLFANSVEEMKQILSELR